MYEAAPNKMGDISAHLGKATVAGLSNAKETHVKDAIAFGMATSKMFIQTQMFIAGLREELRHRVMESGQTDPLEIFRFAQEIEQIEDKKSHSLKVTVTLPSSWLPEENWLPMSTDWSPTTKNHNHL